MTDAKKDEGQTETGGTVVNPHSPPAPTLPFDAVIVADGATSRRLSPEEFFALPLAERIQHVVQQRASFYSCGQPVDPKAALAQIRKLRTQLH